MSYEVEFKAWPKTPRFNAHNCVITEKLDGTNACVIIQEGEVVGVQSRKRLITPEDDNYGFASWAASNKEALVSLGEGYHYGEWVGLGIQKNPHDLPEKRFYLFNTFRPQESLPEGVYQVPVLYEGSYHYSAVEEAMELLKGGHVGVGAGRETKPEGVIVYFHLGKNRLKVTFENSKGKWNQ